MTEPIRFAYWVPNVSDGLVVSKIEVLREIVAKADREAVEGFGKRVLPILRELEADAVERGELAQTAS